MVTPFRFCDKYHLFSYAMLVKHDRVSDGRRYGRKRSNGQPLLSVAGPPAGATALWGSLIPASGSSGCSTGGVAPRPTTPARQSHWRVKKVALENTEVVSKRSALETTDALPKNFVLGGNGLIFSLDRLFHRRSLRARSLSA
jgi:hypothetical protein